MADTTNLVPLPTRAPRRLRGKVSSNQQTVSERRPGRRAAALAAAGLLAALALLTGCGGSAESGTHYWKVSYTTGLNQYISTTVNDDQIAGQVYYNAIGGSTDSQAWTGTKNADGSYQTTLYSGATLTFDGDELSIQGPENTFTARSVSKDVFDTHESAPK